MKRCSMIPSLIIGICLFLCSGIIPSMAEVSSEDSSRDKVSSSSPTKTEVPENVRQMLDYKMKSEMLDRRLISEYRRRMAIAASKTYITLWNLNKMDNHLRDSVDRSVDKAKERESMWNKAEFLWSDERKQKILDQIIEDILTDFAPHYNRFMEEFTSQMEAIYSSHMDDFQHRLFKGKAGLGLHVPGSDGLLKAGLEGARANFESEQQYKLAGLKKEFDIGVSGVKIGLGVGAVTYLLLRKMIKRILLKKATGVLGRKLTSFITGPLGVAIAIGTIAYDIYDIGITLWKVPDKIADNVYDALQKGYSVDARKEMSSICGQAGEEQIKVFVRYAKEYDHILERLAFDNCPSYTNLTRKMTDSELNQFALTLYTLSLRSHRDICWLVNELGPEIKAMPSTEALCMVKLVGCTSPSRTARWAQLVPNEMCRITESVPLQILCALEPNPNALDAVNRIGMLNERAKNVAALVNPEKVVWLVRNLNSHQVGVILTTPDSVQKVEDTISALAQVTPVVRDDNALKLAGEYALVRRVLTEGLPKGEQAQREKLKEWELEITGGAGLISAGFWLKAMKDPVWFSKQYPVAALIFYLMLGLLVLKFAWWIMPRRQKTRHKVVIREVPVEAKRIAHKRKEESAPSDNKS
jgi:hypothetical protein